VGHTARMGEKKLCTGFFVGKTEVKKPLGRLSCRWKGNIKMYLQEVWRGHGLDWCGVG